MTTFKKLLTLCALTLSVALPLKSLAQTPTAASPSESVQANAMSEGEVRRIDKENGKITLRHGELKNLEMPPMTMVFVVRDPALLDKVKVGDKVRFVAISENKQLIVDSLQLAK